MVAPLPQLSQLQSARQSTEEALAAERLAQIRDKEERWERSAQLQASTRCARTCTTVMIILQIRWLKIELLLSRMYFSCV